MAQLFFAAAIFTQLYGLNFKYCFTVCNVLIYPTKLIFNSLNSFFTRFSKIKFKFRRFTRPLTLAIRRKLLQPRTEFSISNGYFTKTNGWDFHSRCVYTPTSSFGIGISLILERIGPVWLEMDQPVSAKNPPKTVATNVFRRFTFPVLNQSKRD